MSNFLSKLFSGFGLGDIGNIAMGITQAVQSRKQRESNEQLTRETNANNRAMQESANATNIQLQESANAAQAKESQKAYERSTAGAQVQNMQQAGMSRAGAINALNGGGSYTPAAVNSAQVSASQDQAPQGSPTDFSGILQAFASMSANEAQMRNTTKQIKAQAESQDKQIKSQERIERMKLQLEEKRQAMEDFWKSKQENRTQHDHDLAMLSNEMRNAASAVEKLADPAQYDTPAAYRAALYDKATDEQRKYFDNYEFTNVLDLYHAANASAKNVAANISKVNSEKSIAERLATLQERKYNKEIDEIQQRLNHNTIMYQSLEEKTRNEVISLMNRIRYDKSEHTLRLAKEQLEMSFNTRIDILQKQFENEIKKQPPGWNSFVDTPDLDIALEEYQKEVQKLFDTLAKIDAEDSEKSNKKSK